MEAAVKIFISLVKEHGPVPRGMISKFPFFSDFYGPSGPGSAGKSSSHIYCARTFISVLIFPSKFLLINNSNLSIPKGGEAATF